MPFCVCAFLIFTQQLNVVSIFGYRIWVVAVVIVVVVQYIWSIHYTIDT